MSLIHVFIQQKIQHLLYTTDTQIKEDLSSVYTIFKFLQKECIRVIMLAPSKNS